ncbi:hypothetical protein H4R18_000845 [Coemansia javaensis]|uniref:Uncharacterized protein n=1 Tax=Coemansia javaensis TaxID=2761396 RepID=A0A9W8HMF1_9FUNG|nr:hypothetical protein H4R18_000845 [Coemansia javaensis]
MEAPVKIEVKVWLPFADSAGRGGRDRGQQQQGQQGLEALDGVAGGGRLCTASLRRALCQLLAHMCRCEPQVRYGVVIAKNAMLMVRRDGAGRVAVSDPTPYTGTNPHPAALVSFAIAKALGHFLVPRDAPMAGPDSAPQPGRP